MARPAGGPAIRLVIVIAALAASLLVPSTAGAARSEFFGIVQGPTLDGQDIAGTPAAQMKDGMDDARIRTTRFLLNWKWVQPTAGAFRWGATDKIIGQFAFRGIRSLPSAWGNPAWVFGGEARPPMDSAFAQNSWQNFLKALVARYGPTGSYWTTAYRQRYGAGATPLPIQAWQIWNEPNLKKFYVPYPSPQHYARFVRLSHSAIRSRDPKAQVVLAGMPGYGDMTAWDFLNTFYNQNNPTPIKNYFDVVALHPYAKDNAQVRLEIQKVREVMVSRADGATPLWLTEFAWGSAPPDRFGINKGQLQDEYLRGTYKMILQNRTAWNVQRLFWYMWRDPRPAAGNACSFCGSSGFLRYNRTKKPSYAAFRSFTAEAIRPGVRITGGPAQGGFTKDPTPSFSFAVTDPVRDAGSTFVCRIDAGAYKPCTSPYTTPTLPNGSHVFYVRAIDAPGNESPIVWRSFTVDTVPPPAPTITDTDPNSPANDNAPEVKGTAAAGTIVRLYKTAGCAGAAAGVRTAANFASPGITASVPDNTTTAFRARAVDAAGNISACSGAFNYVEDSTP